MSFRFEVTQLKIGYARALESGIQTADGSVTLVKGTEESVIVLVDTGGPWGKDSLLKALQENSVCAADVNYVVGTHGHSDHIGNLNLFPNATFIVCYDICKGHQYFDNTLGQEGSYTICEGLDVIPTPGHTGSDVSLLVRDSQLGTVVVAGDLFESEADLQNPDVWKEVSENPEKQEENRSKVLALADYIVPGHGKMFRVPEAMKQAKGATL